MPAGKLSPVPDGSSEEASASYWKSQRPRENSLWFRRGRAKKRPPRTALRPVRHRVELWLSRAFIPRHVAVALEQPCTELQPHTRITQDKAERSQRGTLKPLAPARVRRRQQGQ